jgi:hypothetical protein
VGQAGEGTDDKAHAISEKPTTECLGWSISMTDWVAFGHACTQVLQGNEEVASSR